MLTYVVDLINSSSLVDIRTTALVTSEKGNMLGLIKIQGRLTRRISWPRTAVVQCRCPDHNIVNLLYENKTRSHADANEANLNPIYY